MKSYIYQSPDWPHFQWDAQRLAAPLASVRHQQGRLIGHMEALGFERRRDTVFATLTQDVLKSSEIEGEILNKEQVRSSVARRLGIETGAIRPADRHVEGVVEMMLDATQRYDQPLSKERLLGWHAALFPTGWSGLHRIRTGQWRDDSNGPMQVVSGPIGRETVHYEAPPADRVEGEMSGFLAWFNQPDDLDPVLKAALAHLWFVTIHPLDDGNGRIARAIADLQLARSEGSSQRFYSMSAQIRLERNEYYDALQRTQSGPLDVTLWIEWFLACLARAIDRAATALVMVLERTRLWESIADVPLNQRQRAVLRRLLDGFEGKLTSTKYATLAKCSQDTAQRDLNQLAELGLLTRNSAGGRSTGYSANFLR